MIYDRIGSALAVAFDQLNSLGFSSASTIAVNTYDVSENLGPLFTGYGQDIRSLPQLSINPSLKFPLQQPSDGAQRIEQSLDSKLTTPVHYLFNLSYARDLGKGYSVEVSYVGRLARHLLTTYDVMQFNNLRDPKSGTDFYSAMRQLISLRNQKTPIGSVQPIPYFQNLFPGLAGDGLTATQSAYSIIGFPSVGGGDLGDWTFFQTILDDPSLGLSAVAHPFVQPQYAAFAAYGTIGSSDYHSVQFSFRKRFSKDLSFDFNYTFSHSLDISSGGESSGDPANDLYGTSFILNPYDLNVNRGNSDFDIRHLINANYIWALPVGKGKKFFGNMGKVTNAIFGGWEMTGIFRYNSGLPAGAPFDSGRWATNWQVPSNGVATRPLQSSPTRTGDPNIFSDPTFAYQSYRSPYPGEFGDRNTIRYPGFFGLDAGLYKAFSLGEGRRLIFRWEVFNVTNTQPFTGIAEFGLDQNPNLGLTPPPDFGNFTRIQGSPRQQQFALRIEF
jgi:hypothetical protein